MRTPGWRVATLSLANFLQSLGGGLVLAKGLKFAAAFTHFPFDSILAFLVGSFLAVALVFYGRRRGSIPLLGISFSLFLSIGSLALISLDGHSSFAAELIFAGLICIYFSQSSTLRAFRSDLAAGLHPQGLVYSEFAYSGGYLVGLLVLVDSLSLQGLFLLQLTTLPLLWALDWYGKPHVGISERASQEPVALALSPSFLPGLALFFALTGSVQITHQRIASLSGTTLYLVAFEIGVTLAPLLAIASKLAFEPHKSGFLVSAWGRQTKIGVYVFLLAFFTLGSVLVFYGSPSQTLVIFSAVTIAAFLYEFVSLGLLSHLGREPGQVSLILGTTGFLCSLAYWALLKVSFLGFASVSVFCALCCLGAMACARAFPRVSSAPK